MRIDHLSEAEQRVLRLAINRMTSNGEWNLDALKLEFEELILTEAPLEVSGFAPDQIDQIIMGDDLDVVEKGELEPPGAVATSRLGDIYTLGPHRVICGSSTDPKTFTTLLTGDPQARCCKRLQWRFLRHERREKVGSP